jgi:uncharacterized membrane protein YagU involved in acid resistance
MNRLLLAIVLGGLAAGALDILYAFVVYGPLSFGISPQRILQSVAAGWMGRDAARAGEWSTAALGLVTHFFLATIMAAVFVFAASALKTLTRRALVWGFLYGLVLYVAMNYVVVPLSAAATGQFAAGFAEATARLQDSFSEVRGGAQDYPWLIWGTLFTHTVLVGVPIALIAKRFAPQQA